MRSKVGRLAAPMAWAVALTASGQSRAFTEDQLASASDALLKAFTVIELSHPQPGPEEASVFLLNGYATAGINDPSPWTTLEGVQAVRVDMVFSRYPMDWGPGTKGYTRLLADRLIELFNVDSTLNTDEIGWNIVLRTDCANEAQARALPHGVRIAYARTTDQPGETTAERRSYSALQLKRFEQQVRSFIKANSGGADSTIEKVMARHGDWDSTLVIMDWTGSMQAYGAKVMLWHVRNFQTSGIKHLVIYTDGERGKDRVLGDQGGVYHVDAADLRKMLRTMRHARMKEANTELEEGDLEAVIKGLERHRDFDKVTLIAENRSCIKDYCLLDRIDVPVRVVLCGTRGGVNPMYVNLAHRTNGSVHTVESDLDGADLTVPQASRLRMGRSKFRYHVRKDRYVATGLIGRWGYQNCARFYRAGCE